MEILERENCSLKEDVALKLLPPLPKGVDPMASNERRDVALKLAKIAKSQGDFKLGAKLYTIGNEKMKGMKCLLKSGDPKAVIGYAQNAR